MDKLKDLDLNLLKVLQVVVKTRNTHLAAQQLGISQTSVSRALSKLKQTFGESLFIRQAHGVEPSAMAIELAAAAEMMLTPIQQVLQNYQAFDAQHYDGEVVIALHIYCLELYGAGIFRQLRQVLPQAKLRLIYWQQDSLEQVLDGQIDYLIQFANYPLPQQLYQHQLQHVKLGLVARREHPVLQHSSAWQDIHSLPLVRLAIDGINSKRAPIEDLYLAKGYQAQTLLVTHSISTLLTALASSDAILFGSSYLSTLSDELAVYPLPAMPNDVQKISICGAYLRRNRASPLLLLLQQSLQQFFNQQRQP